MSSSRQCVRELPKLACLTLIWIYQHSLRTLLGPACRFHPTCSAFAREAIEVHGARVGGLLAARRIGRCHPWHDGGYDPVPQGRR